MTSAREPTEEEWRELAKQALKEQDPEKIVSLAEQIVEKYHDKKRKSPRPPDWTELYQLAVTELDPAKLQQRVADARNAILDRIEETHTKPFPYEERQQLTDALNGLHVVQQEYESRIQSGESRTARNGLRYGKNSP
jgi:hypothetical protein